MSIRLRLTLLYSAILALTLILFGFALYNIQARYTLNALKEDMSFGSGRLVAGVMRTELIGAPGPLDQQPPPPKPFDQFSGDQAFQALPERQIARVLDGEGNLVASPFGRQEDALPLSTDGLGALQSRQEWWEIAEVGSEQMLIYSRPVVQDDETAFIVQVARPLTERDNTLSSLATTLTVAGAATTLLAFAAGWLLSGITLRPIDRITRTAQAIGDERDFNRRVAYAGPPDEVGRLASTFNQMLARLQDAYLTVEQALTQQRSFVADVSHELRTPLTTLRGNLGLLNREPPAPAAERADIVADALEESDRLIRLVNELLLLARADAGPRLRRDPVKLRPAAEEVVRQMRLLDERRTISITIPQDAVAMGDRDAIKQILVILVDNAIKHSTGDLEIGAASSDAAVELRVQDQGPGLAAEQAEHVFDRFYRGEGAPKSGIGLGLAIAKALAVAMGGSIAMESAPGRGSTVRVVLGIK